MTKKNWLLVVFLMVLAAIYAVWFTDWFKPQTIHIHHTIRALRNRRHPGNDEPTLIFGITPNNLRLNEIKVVSLADYQKDPNALPLWHLVSDSNSAPITDFDYGQRIQGMKPAIAGAQAGDLATDTVYRILIKAGKAKGQQDFTFGINPVQTPPK